MGAVHTTIAATDGEGDGDGSGTGNDSIKGAVGRGYEYEDLEDLDDVDELDEELDGNTTASGTKLQRAQRVAATRTKSKSKYKLTQYVPHPGYFLAGALAGGISRTATAPFDRLKVYLLVNTRASTPTPAAKAAKAAKAATAAVTGKPLPDVAVRKTGRPIRDAIVNLYRAGGLRTFFAGATASRPWVFFLVFLFLFVLFPVV